MQQLTEMDYCLLQMENNRTFQHIGVVMIYDQSDVGGGGVRFKQILKVFQRNLHTSPVFRRKLVKGAIGIDTPYWIEDADFDLEYHIRHIALPQPGDWRQLCILLARLHSNGIDLSRPPWEAYVIEGLAGVEGLPKSSFAILLKIHHSAVDGVGFTEIVKGLHTLTDDPEPPLVEDDWQGESAPTQREVWSRALRRNIGRPGKILNIVRGIPQAVKANKDLPPVEEPGDKFKVRFNGRISAHRVIEGVMLELDEVKELRRSVADVTVNDIIVTVVGGALRKYFQAHGELPETSLNAGVPINLREQDDTEFLGNEIGVMYVTLGTDIDDPVQRLHAVNASSKASKAQSEAMGRRSLLDFSEGVGPILFRAITSLGSRVPQHTVVSNIPGPQVPLYLAGARLHSLMALGPLVDGTGLFHGVVSGGGKISITAVACREMLPDPQFYRDCLQAAWDELQAATRAKTKKRGSTPRRKKRQAGPGSG